MLLLDTPSMAMMSEWRLLERAIYHALQSLMSVFSGSVIPMQINPHCELHTHSCTYTIQSKLSHGKGPFMQLQRTRLIYIYIYILRMHRFLNDIKLMFRSHLLRSST